MRQRNVTKIRAMHQRFQKEMKGFLTEAIELCYWSRGAIAYHDVFDLTPAERDTWNLWLKERLEKEVKRPNPCY